MVEIWWLWVSFGFEVDSGGRCGAPGVVIELEEEAEEEDQEMVF